MWASVSADESMKSLIAVLILILIGLQYKLWFGDGSLSEVVQLSRELEIQKQKLRELEQRNSILEAQVLDLQNGLDAFEEKARNDLGMIKQGETFIQLIPGETGKTDEP
jgi:cell division protein FtsB